MCLHCSQPYSRLEHLEAELRDTRKRLQFTNVRKVFSKELNGVERDLQMIRGNDSAFETSSDDTAPSTKFSQLKRNESDRWGHNLNRWGNRLLEIFENMSEIS